MEQGADHAAVRTLLDRLLQYTLKHFKYEEQVMLAHDYPTSYRIKPSMTKCGRKQSTSVRMPTCDRARLAHLLEGMVVQPHSRARQEVRTILKVAVEA